MGKAKTAIEGVQIDPGEFQSAILDWYDRHARVLPWRVSPTDGLSGIRPDPYRVWLSEVMLQQTTVATVKAYFARFTARWPTVTDLAAEPQSEVLKEWAGLGYYARARNLHRCAQVVAAEFGGQLPETENQLRSLPGIGAYTAAAVASIAFSQRAPVLDGNIERVMARFFAITAPLPGSKKTLYALVDRLTPENRPGDFAQALMDLGATVCTPRSPACGVCPVLDFCKGRIDGIASTLPRKAPKKAKPTRYGAAFVAVREDGAILLSRRPQEGLLGGMMEVPGTDWSEDKNRGSVSNTAPLSAAWMEKGEVLHTFTHFHLRLTVLRADLSMSARPARGRWLPRDTALSEALPTVMKKVLERGLA